MSIELPKLRQEFEAWHGGRYIGLQQEIAWAAWQEAARLALEAAAKAVETVPMMAYMTQGNINQMHGNREEAVDAIRALIASAPGEGKGKGGMNER